MADCRLRPLFLVPWRIVADAPNPPYNRPNPPYGRIAVFRIETTDCRFAPNSPYGLLSYKVITVKF